MSDYPVIRKPPRLYPLPPNIRDLDEPRPQVIKARYARVNRFKKGHTTSDNPTVDKPSKSPSIILSKL